jgi:FKBP-type peptidyl-prolyl cis-trans isomerase FklB
MSPQNKTMKNVISALIVTVGVVGLAGCASHGKTNATTTTMPTVQTPAGTNVLSNEKARVSYAIGMTFAHNFQAQNVEVDPDLLARGLKDSQSGGTALLTDIQMREILDAYQKSLAAKRQQFMAAVAATNKAAGATFLETNKNNPGVITLPDGLQYFVITAGSGALPESNDVVTVNYRGTLLDGTEFDSSIKRGKPAQFPIGQVIHGWTEALQQMPVGSKWRLFIPPQLAYGEQGQRGIPPNSLLIFEVELLGAEHPKPPAPITSDIVKVPSLEEMKKGAKIEVIKPEDAAKAQEAETNQPAK